jgi:hypothetical protein
MSFSAEVLGQKTGVSSSTGSSRRCTDVESKKSYLRMKWTRRRPWICVGVEVKM